MNWQELETWLKTTIPGIIVLGAAGSVIAVWLCKLFGDVLLRVLRWPSSYFATKQTFQAYTLGFSAATIEHDKTGRLIVAFFGYHLAKLMVLLVLGLCGWIGFVQFAYTEGRPALTFASYLGVLVLFLSAYGVYFEFESVRRTFLWLWGPCLDKARESFDKRPNEGFGGKEKKSKDDNEFKGT